MQQSTHNEWFDNFAVIFQIPVKFQKFQNPSENFDIELQHEKQNKTQSKVENVVQFCYMTFSCLAPFSVSLWTKLQSHYLAKGNERFWQKQIKQVSCIVWEESNWGLNTWYSPTNHSSVQHQNAIRHSVTNEFLAQISSAITLSIINKHPRMIASNQK